jgi:hypothetical protein
MLGIDQIMVSETLIQLFQLSVLESRNLQQVFLIQTTGQYKGYPLRHSNTEIGFSDHFPVYI